MNPHEGAVPLAHAGRTVVLRFTWRAVASLQAEWGMDAYADRISRAINLRVVDDMAQLIAITGGITPAEAMEWSPPMTEAATALGQAWLTFWVGPAKAEEAAAGAEADPLMSRSILSQLRSMLGSVRGSAGTNSGTARATRPASA